jgi:hypothetical protein
MTKLSLSSGFVHDLVLLDIHPFGHREVRLQLLSHARLDCQFELELLPYTHAVSLSKSPIK